MNRPFALNPDGIERHRFSGLDVDRMVEAGVLDAAGDYELIDGEVVPMAAQHMPHARMVGRLFRRLSDLLNSAEFEVVLGATVELGEFNRFDPDIFLARSGVASKVVNAADVSWAIEVSDASRRKDLVVKAPIYAAAGVPEYWVVDLEGRMTHIHRGPVGPGWSEPVRQVPFDAEASPGAFPSLRLVLTNL